MFDKSITASLEREKYLVDVCVFTDIVLFQNMAVETTQYNNLHKFVSTEKLFGLSDIGVSCNIKPEVKDFSSNTNFVSFNHVSLKNQEKSTQYIFVPQLSFSKGSEIVFDGKHEILCENIGSQTSTVEVESCLTQTDEFSTVLRHIRNVCERSTAQVNDMDSLELLKSSAKTILFNDDDQIIHSTNVQSNVIESKSKPEFEKLEIEFSFKL